MGKLMYECSHAAKPAGTITLLLQNTADLWCDIAWANKVHTELYSH